MEFENSNQQTPVSPIITCLFSLIFAYAQQRIVHLSFSPEINGCLCPPHTREIHCYTSGLGHSPNPITSKNPEDAEPALPPSLPKPTYALVTRTNNSAILNPKIPINLHIRKGL